MEIYTSLLPPIEDYLTGRRKTLGFGVLEWCSRWLVNPDGVDEGAQWVFQPDQAHFILAFYELDETGEWIYRRAYRERAKGTGKSPMVAAIACAEFLGPTVFDYFDDDGMPVGKRNPSPNIWLAATSLDGSDHTYKYATGMLTGKAEEFYRLDIGLGYTKVIGKPAWRLKQITASPKSIRGPRPTFVVQEETQDWVPAEGGRKLNEAIQLGLSKTNGRSIEVTNAPEPGAESIAEDTHKYQKMIDEGEVEDSGLLFDTYVIKVKDIYDKDQAIPALEHMYRNAPWQNLKRLWRDINDPQLTEVTARRFYFNEIVDPQEMWLTSEEWDKCKNTRMQLNKRDKISLGFRVRKGCGAVVATRLKDSAVFLMKMWERPDDPSTPRDWEVPFAEIDKFVRKIIETYNVVYVMSSPNMFRDVIGRWVMDYQDPVVFDSIWLDKNKTKHSEAVDAFESAVRDQRIKHTGDPELTKHVMRTFVTEVPQGRLIRMETIHSKRYIVAAEAALLSFQGSLEAIEDGLLEDAPDNYLFSF